ncbi:MAG: hypothetical protein RLZZ393_1748 [Pseudomonadota bacterium]
MTQQVDFHILGESSDAARLRAACRLAEQAFLAGRRVLAWTEDAAATEELDTLLWTFGDRAFVPHEVLSGDGAEAPVQISHASAPPASGDRFDVLLNLRACAVPPETDIARIIEVIDGDAGRRQEGRDRFRAYRERGLTPTHHNLDSEARPGHG